MSTWNGKTLWVDLSSNSIDVETIPLEFRLDYLGGRGINSKILYDEVGPEVDPLSQSNVLIIGAGALDNSAVPGATRSTITAKSPLTNMHGDSNAGGHFPIELKKTGYDHIVIKGKAAKPVYLLIDNSRVEIRDADSIWGRNAWQTQDAIKEELHDKEVKVAAIGQAGENMVRYACILNGLGNAWGRTGMGAVMGSKNLKAVAVRGSGDFDIAFPEEFKSWRKEMIGKAKKMPDYALKSKYGTSRNTWRLNSAGALGANNLSLIMPDEMENIYHDVMGTRFTRINSCPGCAIHCKHDTKILEGPYKGEEGGAIEYSAISAFGPHCGNYNPDSLIKLNNLANQYGIDVMECGYTLGYVMDWYEKGLIKKEDMDGIDLRWGNWEGMIEMVHKIAKREGFGNILAEGPLKVANWIGGEAEKCVSHAKGLTWGGDVDIRIFKGYGFNLATSTRGADHLRGLPAIERGSLKAYLSEDIRAQVVDKFGTTEVMIPTSYKKASPVIYYQDICTAADALGICKFWTEACGFAIGFKEMADMFYLVTGIEIDEESLRKAAGRIYNLERAFIIREGMSKKDDYILGKYADEPIPGGPFKGEYIDRDKFTEMLDEYYLLRGWNLDDGIPNRRTLEAFGLQDVANDLERRGLRI